MKTMINKLFSLSVADVMNRKVLQIPVDYTMGRAAAELLVHEVTGAPVIDDTDRCVGMLSATDFMRRALTDRSGEQPILRGESHGLAQIDPDAPLQICDSINRDQVERHMTADVKSIGAGASLAEAARAMCRAHVHRLPVLGFDGKVQGIISSLDIVAALMNAAEELEG